MAIDFVYREEIGSVQLFPYGAQKLSEVLPPFIPLAGSSFLQLEFDIFGDDAPYFAARIEHCNPDWSLSGLPSLEYLKDYNEFRINNFEFSANTKVPFVHFWLKVPKPNISGNFLLVVYEEGKKDLPVLSKRFVVYEEAVAIRAWQADITAPGTYRTMHQIKFKVNHSNLPVANPTKTISSVILQNGRWDNSKKLRPLYINQAKSELDFSYFDEQNAFMAGNEFRSIDLGNFQSGGFGVKSVDFAPKVNRVFSDLDIPRNGKSYNSTFQDLNGGFYIGCFTCKDAGTYADYAQVFFALKAEVPFEGDVYLNGAFSDWHLLPKYRMFYNPEKQQYQLQTLLKQGRYDYQYSIYYGPEKRDDVLVDGSFSETQNDYYILIYHFPLGSRKARVIGMSSLSTSRR